MERRVEGFGLPESRIIPVVDPRQRIGLGGLLLLASIAGICCDDGNVHNLSDRSFSYSDVNMTAAPDWLEMELWGFRLWMIIGLVLLGIMIVVIALCCIFDCRIPRTKQDIQTRIERAQAAKRHISRQKQTPRNVEPTDQNEAIAHKSAEKGNSSALPRQEKDLNRGHRQFQETPIDNSTNEKAACMSRVNQVTEEFPLEDKHYGRRLLYVLGRGIEEQKSECRQFRPDPRCTANSLASLHDQSYSRV